MKTAEANVADIPSSPTSTHASSAGSDADWRFSLNAFKSRRSLSNREPIVLGTSPGSRSSGHSRKLSKSKSRNPSTSSIGALTHRGSAFSDDSGQLSAPDVLSRASSPSTVDWQSQKVEAVTPLESDTHLLRTKTPYLVVTSEYLVKAKNRSDVCKLFPSVAERAAVEPGGSLPEPALAVPLSSIVAVFVAESTRPSFGIEVWWKSPSGLSFQQATFFFNLPRERDQQMHHISRGVRAYQHDEGEMARPSPEVLRILDSIHDSEEPGFAHRKLEVFPVVPRGGMRREYIKKAEDTSKKPQETPSFYLVVGTYLCYFVVIHQNKSGESTHQHKTFGLVTLEKFRGDWVVHEERFNISFRNPMAARVTLELASCHYRRIIRVFGLADRYLKPVWPQMWQSAEIFHVTGLKEPQYLVPREDFGSVRRTLDAYMAAYDCAPVEWEINWKTRFPPEFRVLPAKDGSRYKPLQLLAVLRALRYNDYFNSLSFRDVDLGVLWDAKDPFSSTRGAVAYLSRTCVTLDADEVEILQQSSLLHQEFHALAFCSETIQQIDFTNCTQSVSSRTDGIREAAPFLQFLTPILNLLRSDITKCSNLILARNPLLRSDLEDIVETLEACKIQTLDVSSCGLCEVELRNLIGPLLDRPQPLQSLNLSENPGRLPADFLPQMLYNMPELRELNLRGSLQAGWDTTTTLIPFEILDRLTCLEELDISGFKVNYATIRDLGEFLHSRAQSQRGIYTAKFRKLVLNHCGITGSEAAKLCRAVGYNSELHLSLSGNPLEDGIEDLADAIRSNQVPAGLYLEVVEFKEESNYNLLILALAETESVSLLSLAGTAPTPSLDTIHQTCSGEMIETLEYLFSHNKSIRYLDLTGFSGKLEDGQLARGFARALAGLSDNTTLTHLKIRNQNLHDDVGTLGRALSTNKTLRVLDCQDNNFNLTSIKFLVSSLKDNDRIIEFPFTAAERAAIWNNILQGLHKSSAVTYPAKGTAAAEKLNKAQEVMLRDVLNRQFDEIDKHLRRNRLALGEVAGQLLEFEMSAGSLEDMEDTWLGIDPEEIEHSIGSNDTTPTIIEPRSLRRPTVRSSYIHADTSISAPYHVRHGMDGMESPTETLDPASEISTPPEIVGENAPEDLTFKQMMAEFREIGLA
ncbi:protein NLRC3 [Podospora aff. communis PSN243]|uniref:Protein NLRC3 n=1 Tax=Podospora aff. communis PSN243 TaxID=3040156 RepID=A0AAV9GJ93_9PEZI|nr:protein NLRC3 [Podospora aff. communis PSN243]